LPYFEERVFNLDTHPSVRVLSWFHYPDGVVLKGLFEFLKLRALGVFSLLCENESDR